MRASPASGPPGRDGGARLTHLTPEEALCLRQSRRGQVILKDVLLASLARLNRVRSLNRELPFTEEALQKAAAGLLSLPFEGRGRFNPGSGAN